MFRALEVLSEVKTRLSHLGRSSIHIVRTRNRYGNGYSQNPSEYFFYWSSKHFPLGHHGKPMLHGHQIWGWKITPTPKKCEILGQKMKDIIFSTTTMIYEYIGMPDMILVQIHDFFHKKSIRPSSPYVFWWPILAKAAGLPGWGPGGKCLKLAEKKHSEGFSPQPPSYRFLVRTICILDRPGWDRRVFSSEKTSETRNGARKTEFPIDFYWFLL